jgi:nicotinate-nucleotide adenylyltransferase
VKTGLYGGSFDPVHAGHVALARRAVAELALDRLIVLPAAVSPFKTASCPGLDARRRLALVTVAFAGVAKTVVDDRELRRGGVSFAIDTVREIAAENPGAEIFFIIGDDSREGLPRWKAYDELVRLCTFRSYPRTAESSTDVRRRLAAGEPLGDLVPEAVALFLRHGVTLNEDETTAALVAAGLSRKEGYCPCRLPKAPEFFCPCEEFRAQLADPAFSGLCHCRLYRKPR